MLHCAVVASMLHTPPLPSVANMLEDGPVDGDWMAQAVTATTRIAVVGSSGNLLFRNHGADIDAHDIVIRINDAITDGHTNDVGRRTDWRVVARSGFMWAIEKHLIDACKLVISTCSNLDQGECSQQYDQYVSRRADRTIELGVAYTRIHQPWAVQQLWDESLGRPDNIQSTGFVAIGMAVALSQAAGAQAPSVFGFGACEPCARYFACPMMQTSDANDDFTGGEMLGVDDTHPFGSEAVVRSQWNRAGVIKLTEPSCDGFAQQYARPLGPPALPFPPFPPSPPLSPPAALRCQRWQRERINASALVPPRFCFQQPLDTCEKYYATQLRTEINHRGQGKNYAGEVILCKRGFTKCMGWHTNVLCEEISSTPVSTPLLPRTSGRLQSPPLPPAPTLLPLPPTSQSRSPPQLSSTPTVQLQVPLPFLQSLPTPQVLDRPFPPPPELLLPPPETSLSSTMAILMNAVAQPSVQLGITSILLSICACVWCVCRHRNRLSQSPRVAFSKRVHARRRWTPVPSY